jgi:hypothetical protein
MELSLHCYVFSQGVFTKSAISVMWRSKTLAHSELHALRLPNHQLWQ